MDIDVTVAPLSELQKQADELRDGIRDVDENIKKVTGRNYNELRRGFNQRMNKRRINREKLPAIEEHVEDGEIGSPVRGHVTQKSHHAHINAPEEEKEIPVMSEVMAPENKELAPIEEKEIVLDEETCKRSKRMFNHMLGTLKKFKQENENSKDLSLKRQEIEKKFEEKAAKEQEEAMKQRKELIQLRVEKQRNLRSLRKQIWLKELEENTVEYFDIISDSILLSGPRPIFYTPAKHNEVTIKKMEDTKDILMKRRDEYIKLIPDFINLNSDKNIHNIGNEDVHSSETSSNGEERDEEVQQIKPSDEPHTNEKST